MSVIVPLVLDRENPMVARAIRLACRTQVDADRHIAKYLPGYVGDYVPTGVGEGVETRKPMTQSQHTLSGGRSSFTPSRRRRPKAVVGADGWSLKAVVHGVPEPLVRNNQPLYPKSYVDRPRPEPRPKSVPALTGDEMWLTRPVR